MNDICEIQLIRFKLLQKTIIFVIELFDKKLGFLLYERLYNFNSLPEVLEGKDATIILYQYTKFEGHYIILLKHDDNTYEVFTKVNSKIIFI